MPRIPKNDKAQPRRKRKDSVPMALNQEQQQMADAIGEQFKIQREATEAKFNARLDALSARIDAAPGLASKIVLADLKPMMDQIMPFLAGMNKDSRTEEVKTDTGKATAGKLNPAHITVEPTRDQRVGMAVTNGFVGGGVVGGLVAGAAACTGPAICLAILAGAGGLAFAIWMGYVLEAWQAEWDCHCANKAKNGESAVC